MKVLNQEGLVTLWNKIKNFVKGEIGKIDTTLYQVVQELPTSNIKQRIYLVKATKVGSQNIYKEFIYTGDVTATYNASNWEQLGEFKADVDLGGYVKKESGKGLSSNDYTTEEKQKLSNLPTIEEIDADYINSLS